MAARSVRPAKKMRAALSLVASQALRIEKRKITPALARIAYGRRAAPNVERKRLVLWM